MKMTRVATLLSVACFSLNAFATTTTHICKNGSVQRRLEVNVDEANKQAGCSVKYFKDTESPGTETVIFRSDAHSPMCMERAETFINKLASWGYPCTPGVGSTPEQTGSMGTQGANQNAQPATIPPTSVQTETTASASDAVKAIKKTETKKKHVPAGKSDVISDD